jgi:hypothetical protein
LRTRRSVLLAKQVVLCESFPLDGADESREISNFQTKSDRYFQMSVIYVKIVKKDTLTEAIKSINRCDFISVLHNSVACSALFMSK